MLHACISCIILQAISANKHSIYLMFSKIIYEHLSPSFFWRFGDTNTSIVPVFRSEIFECLLRRDDSLDFAGFRILLCIVQNNPNNNSILTIKFFYFFFYDKARYIRTRLFTNVVFKNKCEGHYSQCACHLALRFGALFKSYPMYISPRKVNIYREVVIKKNLQIINYGIPK